MVFLGLAVKGGKPIKGKNIGKMCVFTCYIDGGEKNGGERSKRDVVAERRGKPHRESGTHLVEPHGTHTDTRMHRAKTHTPN